MRVHRIVCTLAVFVLLVYSPATAEDKGAKPSVTVEQWLVLGPIASPLPAFNDEDDKTKVGAEQLLLYPQLDVKELDPVAGALVPLFGGSRVEWTRTQASDTSGVILNETLQPSVVYLAAYVEVPRWMKVDVEVRSRHAVEVFVDGASVAAQKSAAKKDDAKASGSAKLEMGKHLLVVKTVNVPQDSAGVWRVGATLTPGKDFGDAPVVVSTSPARTMTIHDVLDGPSVGGVDVSPDGKLVALSMSKRVPPEGKSQRWVEVRRVDNARLVRELRDIDGSSWAWAPQGNRLSYVHEDDGASTLRVIDLDTSEITTIVENVKDFSGYRWSPDGTFVVYTVSTSPEENKTGVKRMLSVADRRAGERDRSSLYLASVPEGVTRRLTAGGYSARLLDVRPDSKSVLITRLREDLSEGPYESDEVVILHLEDQRVEVLWSGLLWFYGARWSPDGKKLLVTGGPRTFGDVGVDVPEGTTPNDYDTQAYIVDAATKSVDAFTKDFDPAVMSVYWPQGGDVYVVGEAGEYNRLYRYDVRKRKYTEIALPSDVVGARDVASGAPVAVITGSNVNRPPRVYAVDLRGGKARELLNPTAESFKDVEVGKVEDFDFTTDGGKTIVGRVYLPPGFDASRKWPAIVYYYGGTSPVGRDFGGRYPKNLWAAHGYVVYVLQPSGATGFGQEFSAVHVNDWGKTTAGEIIEGTKQFLAAHTYVDPKRVGCIGASFGGFMTELLVTQTDIFAAAVSHAGISDITSYWGEGYWGYQYNAVSAANSFPWNRPDVYIDQSPLFHADKVVTPLLLLHGDADTNVPRGESDQMYAALKLLGKTVEYIRVEGQNHWIVDYKKRIVWNDAILSWFDRWLKDQPEWWNDNYPPQDEASK